MIPSSLKISSRINASSSAPCATIASRNQYHAWIWFAQKHTSRQPTSFAQTHIIAFSPNGLTTNAVVRVGYQDAKGVKSIDVEIFHPPKANSRVNLVFRNDDIFGPGPPSELIADNVAILDRELKMLADEYEVNGTLENFNIKLGDVQKEIQQLEVMKKMA